MAKDDKDIGFTVEESDDILAALDAADNRKRLEDMNNNAWGYSSKGIEAQKAAMTMLSTKTGMYAKIPIMCKGDECPYVDSCKLARYDLAPTGELCPVETAEIELRFNGYSQDFNYEECSFTDKVLISELINNDIMIERCKALIAKEKVPVQDVVAGVSQAGEEYYRPEVSKYVEALERFEKKRNEVYDMMIATRKSKKNSKDDGGNKSVYDYIKDIVTSNFVEEEKPDNIVDANYDEEYQGDSREDEINFEKEE